ncbi:hypothetical protein [Alienimonas californiensis]|uniref:hypothetical protein n=1 Tax=Alienimonas californiensis TaxID=2527989 RepID=UPI0011A7C46D|nr:hypothetical protein [Alienimonas californiensis]
MSDRRRRLLQQEKSGGGEGRRGEGLHQAEPDPPAAASLQQVAIPESQHDGAVLPPLEGLPTNATRYKKKAANFAGMVWLPAFTLDFDMHTA